MELTTSNRLLGVTENIITFDVLMGIGDHVNQPKPETTHLYLVSRLRM